MQKASTKVLKILLELVLIEDFYETAWATALLKHMRSVKLFGTKNKRKNDREIKREKIQFLWIFSDFVNFFQTSYWLLLSFRLRYFQFQLDRACGLSADSDSIFSYSLFSLCIF